MFGKKKKQEKSSFSDDNFDYDDIDYLASDEENFSASEYPIDSYEDIGDDVVLEDDILGIDDEKSAKSSSNNSTNKSNIILFIVLGIIGAIVIGYFTVGGSSSDNADNSNQQEDKVDSKIDRNVDGIVVNEKENEEYVGNEDGAPVNGSGAILAYDYDYYHNRNGNEARKHFNPDISNYDGEYLQNHIDKVPSGTEYELKITPKRIGEEYDVILSLSIPGEETQSWQQKVTVMEKDGTFYVKRLDSSSKIDNTEEGGNDS